MTLETYLNLRSNLIMQKGDVEMRLLIARRELDRINQTIAELDKEGREGRVAASPSSSSSSVGQN